MTFKDPLTHDDLRTIRERQPWNSDVIAPAIGGQAAALGRVARLPTIRCFKRPAGITGSLYHDFMRAQREEPCVIERDQDVQEMMETPEKLRKGMAPR